MPLDDLDGIANVQFAQQQTITWEAATDWDTAVTDTGMVHENTSNTSHNDASLLKKGFGRENPPLPTALSGYWLYQESSGDRCYDFEAGNDFIADTFDTGKPVPGGTGLLGTNAWVFTKSDKGYMDLEGGGTNSLHTGSWTVIHFHKTSDSGTQVCSLRNTGELEKYQQLDGFETRWYDGNSYQSSGTSFTSGAWHMTGFGYDNGSNDVQHILDGSVIHTDSFSGQDDYILERRHTEKSSIDRHADGNWGPWMVFGRTLTSSELQQIYDTVFGESELVTDTKSSGSTGQPDLTGMDYTLNSQDIIVDVIGSPGTASEETVTQQLDGSTSYALSWTDSHQDFRVGVRMQTSNPEVTPTLNSVSLAV